MLLASDADKGPAWGRASWEYCGNCGHTVRMEADVAG